MCHSIKKEIPGNHKEEHPKGSEFKLSCKQTAIVRFVEYDEKENKTIVRLVK